MTATSYTFKTIRAGFVANLASLGIQSTGYVQGEIMAPTVEVFQGETTYDETFGRGMDTLIVTVRLTVTVTLDVPAQQLLDEYLAPSGAKSVKTLIESDKTLGGAVKGLQVISASGYQLAMHKSGGMALSCDWTVQVYA